MNEKEYWVSDSEQGVVRISEDVIASIASIAASEVEGVNQLSAPLSSEIASILGKKQLTKGVKISIKQDTVGVDVNFVVTYGYAVSDVAAQVQQAVKSSIEAMTGLQVSAVNACVTAIAFEAPVAPVVEPEPQPEPEAEIEPEVEPEVASEVDSEVMEIL